MLSGTKFGGITCPKISDIFKAVKCFFVSKGRAIVFNRLFVVKCGIVVLTKAVSACFATIIVAIWYRDYGF